MCFISFLLDRYFGDTGFFLYTLIECDCFIGGRIIPVFLYGFVNFNTGLSRAVL